jgi:hypothetical protein
MTGNHAMNEVNLLKEGARNAFIIFGRHNKSRPELGSDTSGTEAPQVGSYWMFQVAGIRGEVESVQIVVHASQILPWDVIMAFNERDFAENLPDFVGSVLPHTYHINSKSNSHRHDQIE